MANPFAAFATVNHIPLALGIPYVSLVQRDLGLTHADLRSTVRGSSTSSSMTSLGKGVAVINVTPSGEEKRCHAPCGLTAIMPPRSAKDLGPSSPTISSVAAPSTI